MFFEIGLPPDGRRVAIFRRWLGAFPWSGYASSFSPRSLSLLKCSSFVFSVMLWAMAVAAMIRSASGISSPLLFSLV